MTTPTWSIAVPASVNLGTPLTLGLYYIAGTGAVTTNTPAEANELAVPFLAGATTALVGAAVSVTSAGTTGALLRLGIRADNNGQPDTLLTDGGTVAADTTGTKTWTINQQVVKGIFYWVTLTVQGGVATRPTIQAASGTHDPRIGHASAATLLSMAAGVYQSGAGTTTGTLPSTQASWSATSTVPRIAVRA